ncbi:MAG TPA: hypothetical protein VF399_09700 [bacterium]
MNEFTEIFRHQQPFVADMVFNVLREAKIPCYKQEGAITGLLQAFPVFPVAYPGIEFIIFVSKKHFGEAKAIVEKLPVDQDFMKINWGIMPFRKKRWTIFLFLLLVIGLPLILTIFIWLFGR